MSEYPGHELYVEGQRPFYDSQTTLDGVYIASKSDFKNKAPVHKKQLNKIIPPGFCIETWKNGELTETLYPDVKLTSNEFFKRFGEFPCKNFPGVARYGSTLRWPETSIAVIRSRRGK